MGGHPVRWCIGHGCWFTMALAHYTTWFLGFYHGTVGHERVWDRNYVILLHSYGDLCYRLHIYFLTLLCLYIQPYHSPTHNQHQHICLCVGDEPQHFSTKNFTLSHSKQSKPKAFPKSKTFIPNLVFQTITLDKGRRCV
jgi:hypothetical protein